MKILLTVLILGLSASFVYQQLQFRSLKSELQLLGDRINSAVLSINQSEKISAPTAPEDNGGFAQTSPTTPSDQDHSLHIDGVNKKLTELEGQMSVLETSLLKLDGMLLSLQQAPPPNTPEPSNVSQISLSEQRQQSRDEALARQSQIEEKLAYEEVESDWALPMESKITDSLATNDAFVGADIVQAQCKTTLCEISIFYNPETDDDLLEFENEILATLGENLSNVHRYNKTGSVEDGYSFTLIASP